MIGTERRRQRHATPTSAARHTRVCWLRHRLWLHSNWPQRHILATHHRKQSLLWSKLQLVAIRSVSFRHANVQNHTTLERVKPNRRQSNVKKWGPTQGSRLTSKQSWLVHFRKTSHTSLVRCITNQFVFIWWHHQNVLHQNQRKATDFVACRAVNEMSNCASKSDGSLFV